MLSSADKNMHIIERDSRGLGILQYNVVMMGFSYALSTVTIRWMDDDGVESCTAISHNTSTKYNKDV